MMLGSKLRSWVETHLTRSKRKRNKRTSTRPTVDDIQWSPPLSQSSLRPGRTNAPLVFHLQQEAAAKGQAAYHHGRNTRGRYGEEDHQTSSCSKDASITMSPMQRAPTTPVFFPNPHGRNPVAASSSSHHTYSEPQPASTVAYRTPPAPSSGPQSEYWTRFNDSTLSSPRPRTSIRTNPWVHAHGRRSPKQDSVLSPSPLWNRRSCDSVETESSSGVTGSLHSPYSAESESSARDSAIGSDLTRDSNGKLSSNTLTPEEEDLRDSNSGDNEDFISTFSLTRGALKTRTEPATTSTPILYNSDSIKRNLRSERLPLSAQEMNLADTREEKILDTVCRQVQHAYQGTAIVRSSSSIATTPSSLLSPSPKSKPERDAQFYQLIQDTEQVLRQLELDELNLRSSAEEPLGHLAGGKVLSKERLQSQSTEARKKRCLPNRTRLRARANLPSTNGVDFSDSDTSDDYVHRQPPLHPTQYLPPQSEPAKRKVYRKSTRHDSPRPLSPAEQDFMSHANHYNQQQMNHLRARSRRASHAQCQPVHPSHSLGISFQHSCPSSPAVPMRGNGPFYRSQQNREECVYSHWTASSSIYPCAVDTGSFSRHSSSSRQPSPSPSHHFPNPKSSGSSWHSSFDWEQQQQMQEEILALRKYLRDALIENDCPFPVDRYV